MKSDLVKQIGARSVFQIFQPAMKLDEKTGENVDGKIKRNIFFCRKKKNDFPCSLFSRFESIKFFVPQSAGVS